MNKFHQVIFLITSGVICGGITLFTSDPEVSAFFTSSGSSLIGGGLTLIVQNKNNNNDGGGNDSNSTGYYNG